MDIISKKISSSEVPMVYRLHIFSGLAALLGIVLWILLVVESHQDKTLNEQAIQERKENGEY